MKMYQTLNALKRPSVRCKRVVRVVMYRILRFAAFAMHRVTQPCHFPRELRPRLTQI